MAYTKPVEVVAPPYVPYTPPNGEVAPPYIPYIPPPMGGTAPPYTPPPDYGFKPPPKDSVNTMAIVPWYNSKTGQTFLARSGGYTPPNSDWVRGDMGPDGKITPRTPPTEKPVEGPRIAPPYIPPALGVMPPVADPRDSRGGGGRTAPEPSAKFSPTSEGAAAVSRFGQGLKDYPAIAPGGMAAQIIGGLASNYGDYMARNVNPDYGHEAMNTTAGKNLGLPSISADDDNSAVLGLNGSGGASVSSSDFGGGSFDPGGRDSDGTPFAKGGIAALPLYKPKTGRSPKKPK